MAWVNLNGPVIADTAYSAGVLIAKDITLTLPAVTLITTDYKAMGTMSLPIPGQLEAMEASITKIGIDIGLTKLILLKSIPLEFRWVQDTIIADGTSAPVGCKAFLKVIPKSLPSITIEPGSVSESELTFEVTRYQVYCGGKELWLIDRLAQIYKIDGKDYYKDIANLL